MQELVKTIGTNINIELFGLKQREFDFYKECFQNLLDIKDKIIMPGQVILHLNELGNVMQIEIKGTAWRRKRLDKVV